VKPFRYALLLALVYGVTAAAYIWLSGVVAAHLASNVHDLARIERIKGFAYVGTTAMILFVASWLMFRRLRRATEEAGQLRQATVMAQSRVLAGELAAAVAHDFNNALMVASCAVEAASEAVTGEVRRARLREASDALILGQELAKRLAQTARGEKHVHLQTCDLVPIARATLKALAKLPRLRGRKLQSDFCQEATALADVVMFEQILANLVLNAADATADRGAILVVLAVEQTHVCLEVHDDGPGIPPEKRESIFTAFESSKPDGLGLGLVSALVAVQALNGSLTVDDSSLGGAAFLVQLPKPREKTASGP